jgi:hypothetical protein
MNKIKKYLESIMQYSFPKTRALEQELGTVRKAHSAVSADLAKLRENLQCAHEDDTRRLVDLQQQIRQIESERNIASEQIEQLKSALADAEQRQSSTEADVSVLGAKLEEERSKARMQVDQLEHVLADAKQNQSSTEADVSLLGAKLEKERSKARMQVEQLERALADAEQRQSSTVADVSSLGAKFEEERSNVRKQVEQLEHALADAEQRQKSTETQVGILEKMLEEEHNSHEAGIRATETILARMQSDQETHAKLQSELADTLQDITMRLQGTLQLQRTRPPYPLLKLMVMAVVLFVTGALAGMFALQSRQDGVRELAAVKRDVGDMREFMEQHIDHQDTVFDELALALNQQPAGKQAPVGETPPVPDTGLQDTEKQPQNTVFKADIRELQESLIALGFDLGISKPNGEPGIKTRQALQEFREFYLPDSEAQDDVISEPLAALILKSADRVRDDAAHFNIRNDVLAAIRMGSIRTGVDFSFLMEGARVESNFNPLARAPRSSSTGLFQFKDSSWLQAIRTFGADYGLEDYATRVKPIEDENHDEPKPIVRDPLQLEVLALRLNPRLSTLMAAEYVKRNQQILSASTGHEPGRTELYLAHYLGPDGAALFLKTLDEAPATIAGDIFPEDAASNPGVFQRGQGQPRTVAEVYRFLDGKFDTARYAMRNPG